jgi:hypothetical protein
VPVPRLDHPEPCRLEGLAGQVDVVEACVGLYPETCSELVDVVRAHLLGHQEPARAQNPSDLVGDDSLVAAKDEVERPVAERQLFPTRRSALDHEGTEGAEATSDTWTFGGQLSVATTRLGQTGLSDASCSLPPVPMSRTEREHPSAAAARSE